MNKLWWSFLAGFVLTVAAFLVVSAVIMHWLEQPVPGWLTDPGGR